MMLLLLVGWLSTIVWYVHGASPDQWRTRTIYQIVTDRFAVHGSTPSNCNLDARQYCGGNFQGIIDKLDYIQGAGFDAVWISPIVTNLDTSSSQGYHGYWSQDIYSVNQHFGASSDLKALSDALHSRGMYLMVDIVVNHMGPQENNSPGTQQYVITYNPFNQISDFHPFCTITDYNNQTDVEQCWLGSQPSDGLADLNTENDNVVSTWNSWVSELVANYSIDGLRIDTLKHVRKDFWPAFNNASRVYCVGEVLEGDPTYVGPYQQVLDATLNYPLFYPLTRAFQNPNQGFSELINMIDSIRSDFKDPGLLGNFLENQDNPRFPSLQSDLSLIKGAMTYILTGDGIPIIYYGQEQQYSGGNDPYNRESLWPSGYSTTAPLYLHIATINKLRSHVKTASDHPLTTQLTSLYNDSSSWAFNKGNMLVVLSSAGSNGGSQTVNIGSSSVSQGQLTDILDCSTVTVGTNGAVSISITNGQSRVFYPTNGLASSGICGH